jgi:hypothetical protein
MLISISGRLRDDTGFFMARIYARRLVEWLYAALAYTSAVAILAIGGALLVLAMRREIVCASWQVVLGCMLVPLLAAVAWSCGNYRESPRVRAITSIVFVPLGLVNPLMWLCALAILLRGSEAGPEPPRPGVVRPRPLLCLRHARPIRQPVELRVEDRRW